jgi:hypothetical protein
MVILNYRRLQHSNTSLSIPVNNSFAYRHFNKYTNLPSPVNADFSEKLPEKTPAELKKICKDYHIKLRDASSKSQMISIISNHFRYIFASTFPSYGIFDPSRMLLRWIKVGKSNTFIDVSL